LDDRQQQLLLDVLHLLPGEPTAQLDRFDAGKAECELKGGGVD
jgi:hypothetical protein